MNFYTGTHKAHWLGLKPIPWFVSYRHLRDRKTLPRALDLWAEDSSGFTEVQQNGCYTFTEAQYVADLRRHRDEIGNLEWAAPMDWMCEPIVIARGTTPQGVNFRGTGLSVEEHQRRTVENFVTLRMLAPELPIIPVLQGWEPDDYFRCRDLYASHGVDLSKEQRVGVGSVCRRQQTSEVERVIFRLWQDGLRLHGFGFKIQGLARCWDILCSADSLAWSYDARRAAPLPGHTHKSCANCLDYALAWRDRLLDGLRDNDPQYLLDWDGRKERAA